MENREPLKPFLLAFPGPLRDRLVAAVLSGAKVSTSGLLAEYEVEKEDLPPVGSVPRSSTPTGGRSPS